MSVLTNNLNIKDLYVHDPNNPKSVEFCYLFLTSAAFRAKSNLKQADSVNRLRANIGKQLQEIVDNDSNSRAKEKLLSYPNGGTLAQKFLDPDHVLGDDFIFVMENLVNAHSFVFVVNDFFVASKPIDKKSKLLIILRRGRSAYYPVFLKHKEATGNAESSVFVLNTSYDSVQLINSFHINKAENLPTPNNRSASVARTEASAEAAPESPARANRTKVVVQRDDVVFEDFEDELIINYNNEHALIKFTKEEQILHIQNLLMSADKDEKGNGADIYELIRKFGPDSSQPNTGDVSLYNMRTLPVSAVDKLFGNDYEYIEDFTEHAKRFVTPYVRSIYTNPATHRAAPLDETDVARNSFTATFDLWNAENEEGSAVDREDCAALSKVYLDRVLKKFKIVVPKRMSRDKACDLLLNHNFLAASMASKISQNRAHVDKVREIVDTLENVPKSVKASTTKSIKHVLAFAYQKLKERIELADLFDKDDMLAVAKFHGLDEYLSLESVSASQLFDILSNVNVLSVHKSESLQQEKDNAMCEEDDIRALTELSLLTPQQGSEVGKDLEIFRAMHRDDIPPVGFYYEGNPRSAEWVVFDVENYLNILHNITSFGLPLKCVVRFHTSFDEIEGTVVESLEDNDILKIKLADNSEVYYNLNNIHDNRFFVYPEVYGGYRFFKGDLMRNVFFKTNRYPYDDIRALVSLSLQEYAQLFDISVETFEELRDVLKRFNVSVYAMNAADHDTIANTIRVRSRTTPSPKSAASATDSVGRSQSSRLTSRHSFLRSIDDNIPDTHKMVELHKQDYYNKIYDVCVEKYANHSADKMDRLVKRPPNPDNKDGNDRSVLIDVPEEIGTRPATFSELVRYKDARSAALNHNNDIHVSQRLTETARYVENLTHSMTEFRAFVENLDTFFNTPHEKQFIQEMSYTKKSTKTFKGSEANEFAWIFRDTNPDSLHAPLPTANAGVGNANTDPATQSVDHKVLSKIVQIAGAPIEASEYTYIVNQTNNVFMPNLLQLKFRNKSSINQNELKVWSNFSKIVLFSAFITIFTQYKYRTNPPLFKRCRAAFSLRGYPLDAPTNTSDTSLVKYVACTVFAIFGRQNSYFQSEKYVESQITAYIKLIFQNNSIIKELFETRAKEVRRDTTKKETRDTPAGFKPYYGATDLKDRISSDLRRTNAAERQRLDKREEYRAHSIQRTRTSAPFARTEHLFQLICSRGVSRDIPALVQEFKNTRMHSSEDTRPSQSDDEEEDDRYDDEVSELISALQSELNLDLREFVDVFVVHTDPSVLRYIHLLKLNQLFDRLITKYPDMFEPHGDLLRTMSTAATTPAHKTSVTKTVLNMLLIAQSVLQEMVNTDNIYTFLNVSIDEPARRLFNVYLSELEAHLQEMVTKFRNQTVNVDDLKYKKELLREERKQKKMQRYDGLTDDQIHVLREMEGVGFTDISFTADQPDDENSREDVENERMDARAEDDDYDE